MRHSDPQTLGTMSPPKETGYGARRGQWGYDFDEKPCCVGVGASEISFGYGNLLKKSAIKELRKYERRSVQKVYAILFAGR